MIVRTHCSVANFQKCKRKYVVYDLSDMFQITQYCYVLRGDESDYSEDAPYGENKSDDGSPGSASRCSVKESSNDAIPPVMTKYVQDELGEVFGTANDQVRMMMMIMMTTFGKKL